MNIYVWRHNKTYHSHSMIDEPCVNSEFYLDALLCWHMIWKKH